MTYANPTPNCKTIMALQFHAYAHFDIDGFSGPNDPRREDVIDWIRERIGDLHITQEDVDSLEDNNAHCGAEAAERVRAARGSMTRVTLHVVCAATVNETWVLDVPDDLDYADPLDLINGDNGVVIISCNDEVSDERDREVVLFEAGENT